MITRRRLRNSFKDDNNYRRTQRWQLYQELLATDPPKRRLPVGLVWLSLSLAGWAIVVLVAWGAFRLWVGRI